MTYDFIFCPLCGATKWLADKTLGDPRGKLTVHKCSGCKKFKYTNITVPVEHPIFTAVTQSIRYEVLADIAPYSIRVHHLDNFTEIYDHDARSADNLIIKLEKAIPFNWYSDEDVIEKIKKYLLFS